MTSDNARSAADPGPLTIQSLIQSLLESVPSKLAEIVRVGALPHWLDESMVSVLFPDNHEPTSILEQLQRFRFVAQAAPGQFVYQRQVRDHILEAWLKDQPDLFRQLNDRLASYFYGRAVQAGSVYKVFLPEYVYHLLVADPSDGMAQLERLFEGSVETHELGLAERLAGVVEERRSLLIEQVDWLGYYPSRLALARYEIDSAISSLLELANTANDPYLIATANRALGQGLVQNKQWSEAIEILRRGLRIFVNLRDNENAARTQLSLGDAYRVLAANLGGVYEEWDNLRGIQYTLNVITDLPVLIYQKIADRLDIVPKLYGANYQNWIVLRLLRSAAASYRDAERTAVTSNDERLKIEIQRRLADAELELGRHHNSEKRYFHLLSMSLVTSSPYRYATIALGMARLRLLRKDYFVSLQYLNDSLKIFTQMGDWRLAGITSYLLGHVFESLNKLSDAVTAYATAIEDFTRAKDSIYRTEISSTLNRLLKSPNFNQLDQESKNKVRFALEQVDQRTYVARFPGRIQRWFTVASWMLQGPLLLFMALILAVLFGNTIILVEGNIRNLLSENPVRLGLTDSITIILTALVPFFAIWIRQLLYLFIGLFLPVVRIEKSRPQMYTLDEIGFSTQNTPNNPGQVITWDRVDAVILADRLAWQIPNPLLSKTFLISGSQQVVVTGATHNYQDLQQVIGEYRSSNNPTARPIINCSFEIVRHWWLGVALILAASMAATLVFGFDIYQSFCPTLLQNGICPTLEYQLIIAPLVMWTIIFGVLIFSIGTLIRSIYLEVSVRRIISHLKQSSETVI